MIAGGRGQPRSNVLGLAATAMDGSLGVEVEAQICGGVLSVRGYGAPWIPAVPGRCLAGCAPGVPALGVDERSFGHFGHGSEINEGSEVVDA
jgi:hypothetical protein